MDPGGRNPQRRERRQRPESLRPPTGPPCSDPPAPPRLGCGDPARPPAGPARPSSFGGGGAHAWPRHAGPSTRSSTVHPGSSQTPCSTRLRTLTMRYVRPAGSRFAPRLRRWWSSTAARPGARDSDTHHVGGARREGRRPTQPCACVEGRPAPALNGVPTWAPIG